MRPLVLLLLLALAAPLAAGQAAVAPSLSLDPPHFDLPPQGQGAAIVTITNPTNASIDFTMSAKSDPGVRASFGRILVSVPAHASERVELKVIAPDAADSVLRVRVEATETTDAPIAQPRSPYVATAELSIRVVPLTPTAIPQPQPAGSFRLVPARLDVAPGNATQGTIVFRNTGNATVTPTFEAVSGPALAFTFAAVSAIPPGGQVEIPYGVTARPSAPVGPRNVEILAHGVAAPSQILRLNVTNVGITPPTSPGPAPIPTPRTAEPNTFDERAMTVAAVAVGAAGTWSALWLSRRQWWPLLLALYTRLRPSKMLDHPVRARIVQVVKESPGITFGDLARRVDIAAGQLTHHARMLEKAGIVFSSPDGQTRRFFHVAEGRLAPVAPLAERLLGLVREQQPRRMADAARELGVSRQALHYHVKQLVAQGKLVVRAEGRETWLALPSDANEASRTTAGLARS